MPFHFSFRGFSFFLFTLNQSSLSFIYDGVVAEILDINEPLHNSTPKLKKFQVTFHFFIISVYILGLSHRGPI